MRCVEGERVVGGKGWGALREGGLYEGRGSVCEREGDDIVDVRLR